MEMKKLINDIVIIRGGGDLATGIAHRLHRSGFKILILEIEKPLVIRRTVSFAQAVFDGSIVIDDVKAVKVTDINEVHENWRHGNIPILIDESCDILKHIKANILVDAILAKKNLGTHKSMAPITIGAGPGFEAGVDVDVVIETNRGHYLGSLIFDGFAQANTGVPGIIMGFGKERVIKSPSDGIIRNIAEIGDIVKKDQIIAYVGDTPVISTLDGVLRGLIMDGMDVFTGLKIADVDPRAVIEHCYSISEKARAIGGGVLEAILYMKRMRSL